jgi:hypothetical protein
MTHPRGPRGARRVRGYDPSAPPGGALESQPVDLGDDDLAANVAFAVAAVPSATFAAILAA